TVAGRIANVRARSAAANDPCFGSLSELLYLPEALPAFVIDWALGMAAHAKTMTIRVLHIHFADAPRHICRRLANDRATLFVLLMQRIHILDENADPHAGLTLPSFREKNLDLAPCNATEARGI